MGKKQKNIWSRWYMIVLYCFVGMVLINAMIVKDVQDDFQKETTDSVITKYQCRDNSIVEDVNDCPEIIPKVVEVEVIKEVEIPDTKEESDTATIGEKNALSKALSYLKYSAFSYSGLIDQLEFEGYTYEEAKYGVDNCEADWNEQAALKAQSYLDYSAFSREGLIDQLEFEGFTKAQAEYGVQVVGY